MGMFFGNNDWIDDNDCSCSCCTDKKDIEYLKARVFQLEQEIKRLNAVDISKKYVKLDVIGGTVGKINHEV